MPQTAPAPLGPGRLSAPRRKPLVVLLISLAPWAGMAHPAAAATNVWTPIGPGSGSSNVLSLALAPSRSTVVYAGLAGGGVERSDDGGTTWRPASFGLGDPYVTALAVDPRDPDRVYAGTPSGPFRSTDGGTTWQSARPVLALAVNSLAVDPRQSGVVYAATESGIYKSTDGGVRFVHLTHGFESVPRVHFDVTALAVDPVQPQRVYIARFGHNAQMHKSADGGNTWFPLRRALIDAIAVDPVHNATVWATGGDGILKSTDGGQSWSVVRPAVGYSLAIDPTDPATVYVGTLGNVERTRDGGTTWDSVVAAGLPPTPVNALAPDPDLPGRLLAATGGRGIYRSDNHGDLFRASAQGLINTNVAAFAFAASPEALFVGGPFYGILRSLDHGTTWSLPQFAGEPIGAIVAAPADGRTAYAALSSTGILRTVDGGNGWQRVADLPSQGLAVDAGDPRTVYDAGSGLQKSTDGGVTWSEVFSGSVADVAADPLTPGTVYAVRDLDVYRSRDGGQTWGKLLTGRVPTIGFHALRKIFVAPTSPRTIFAADERKAAASFDGGRTWTLLADGRDFPVTFAVDPMDPDVLYLGSGGGLEQSADRGATWRRFDRGLYGRGLTHVVFDPADPFRLYAATSGAGVFVYEFAH